VLPVVRVKDLGAYSAVVLGSAVYIGSWRKEAVKFLRANEKALADRPVWLFSSGPTGEGNLVELLKGWCFPTLLQPIADRIQPRDIAVFHGVVDINNMNMAFPFVEENNTSRRRLDSLINRLAAEDFARSTSAGWTVSALLAHLAYWDQRMIALLRRWKEHGVDESPVDADAINDALQPLCLALDARAAVDLCLSSARTADAALEAISPSLYEAIQASPNHYRFNRGLHRNGHLDEIERLLQSPENRE
jgi:hypothetical protein